MKRKILCLLLSAVLLLSCCGCGLIRVTKVDMEKPDVAVDDTENMTDDEEEELPPEENESEEEEPEEEAEPEYPNLLPGDANYDSVMYMLNAIAGILEYNSLSGTSETVNLNNLEPEDFYLYLAFVIKECETDGTKLDQFGNIDLTYDEVKLYAESVLPAAYSAGGLPSLNGVTSATTDPKSKYITFSPMSVESKKYALEGFWDDPYIPDTYILRVAVYDADENGEALMDGGKDIFETVLKAWTDTGTHAFQYKLMNISFIEHIDPKLPEETTEENTTETTAPETQNATGNA